jgi:hypothetical protein
MGRFNLDAAPQKTMRQGRYGVGWKRFWMRMERILTLAFKSLKEKAGMNNNESSRQQSLLPGPEVS